MVRLACEVDLSLLGIGSEALLWIATGPGSLETTGLEVTPILSSVKRTGLLRPSAI
jgi:hypothetical protein